MPPDVALNLNLFSRDLLGLVGFYNSTEIVINEFLRI
jgi:hypothetical protein